MRPRNSCLALSLLTVAILSCGEALRIVSPPSGSTVASFDVLVEIHVSSADVDSAGLAVTLNGEPLTVAEGPAGVFTTTVHPGGPLRDENLLRVEAPRTGGHGSFRATSEFLYLPPKARARMITSGRDFLAGPLAHGMEGDFLLENAEARFVVQGPGRRDLHSVGQYGGNLIDAELRSHPGNESFFEIAPSVNIETVINAIDVHVVNDGENGAAAVVRACGPDDLIDYINASSQVAELGSIVSLPPGVDDMDYDVEGCTDYSLEPGATSVRMDTTLFNNEPADVGFWVGDYINGMGELEQWTRSTVPVLTGGIGEILTVAEMDVFSFFGFGTTPGVSYFRVGEPIPGTVARDSSFSTSGVSFVMASNSIIQALLGFAQPALAVPSGGQNTFTRWFGVGTGSGADGIALVLEKLQPGLTPAQVSGCVSVDPGGVPAPGARVSAGPGPALDTLAASWVTDAAGCFAGELAPGEYSFAAARAGTPYQGGGTSPVLQTVSLVPGANAPLDFVLPATSHVRVEVRDEANRPLPARVTVVGFDPSPEPVITYNLLGFIITDTGAFNDVTKDPIPFGIAAIAYADASGAVEFDLEPGDYELVVSRGTEYSIFRTLISPGADETLSVSARIARVLDTTGFISSDYHVHLVNSPDSRISKVNRVVQFAGEGYDNLIATDHDARTDLAPTIESLGLGAWLHTTVGEEITTFDHGHFNGYPLGVDPFRPSGGALDWAGAAPPGQDFPSNGYYVLSPAEIAAEVQNQLTTRGELLNTSPEVTVQINHIDSHFAPLKIDTSQEPPRSFITPAEATAFRLDPSVPNFFHHFPALELWNGANRGAQSNFLDERIGIWFNHLNQGLRTTFIADTDTHTFFDLETAGARTWTPSESDEPAAISDDSIGAAIKAGRAVGGQGVYVHIGLREADDPSNTASFGLRHATELDTGGDPNVELVIEVETPAWVQFDTVEIYANAATTVAATNGGVPVLFGAEPTQMHCLDTSPSPSPDCTATFSLPPLTDVFPSIPGAMRQELRLVVPFALAEDTWFVVVVKGSDGNSEPMFPIYPRSLDPSANATLADLLDGNLGEVGTLALGATNALYANVDGNAQFDPPGVRLAP